MALQIDPLEINLVDIERSGIEIPLIDYNLALSYETRLIEHQRALDLAAELRQAGLHFYEKFEQSPQTPA